MEFRISRHSGFAAPADALDLLRQRLGENRDGVRFTGLGGDIRAIWREAPSISKKERDVRVEIGRRIVLRIVCEVCDSTPELESDWYAISPFR